MKRGETRPAALYELAPGVHDRLSRAYMPFASHLVRTLTDRLSEPELDAIMREVGNQLALEWPRPQGSPDERVATAAALLEELGAPNEVVRQDDTYRIRGYGCLLAAAVHGQPHVCRAVEALIGAVLDTPVRECCHRGKHPRCCFTIDAGK
jgi:predicted ArsR family transcriptional regulator